MSSVGFFRDFVCMSEVLMIWIWIVCLVWLDEWSVRTQTVEGSVFLTQASLSRLSEIRSTHPFLPARAVAQATSSSF